MCLDHGPGNLQSGQIARSRRRGINALALRHVRAVHPGSGDLDQDLAGLRYWQWSLARDQHLRTSGSGDLNRCHL